MRGRAAAGTVMACWAHLEGSSGHVCGIYVLQQVAACCSGLRACRLCYVPVCWCSFDIKSANILLTRELTAKIADVGLARCGGWAAIYHQQYTTRAPC
jgi:hypothetical protein